MFATLCHWRLSIEFPSQTNTIDYGEPLRDFAGFWCWQGNTKLYPTNWCKIRVQTLLVGGFNPSQTKIIKLGSSSPIFGVKIKRSLSCHHLASMKPNGRTSRARLLQAVNAGGTGRWPSRKVHAASRGKKQKPEEMFLRFEKNKHGNKWVDTWCIYLYKYLSIYLSISLPIYLSLSLSIYLSI